MVEAMKCIAVTHIELSVEERNLLAVAYKNVVEARLTSWRVISGIELTEKLKCGEEKIVLIQFYRQKIEKEVKDICHDLLTVIDKYLIPSTKNNDSKVFYYKMKADYLCYLTKITTTNDRREAIENSLVAYKVASDVAMQELLPTHAIPLGWLSTSQYSTTRFSTLPILHAACMAKVASDEASAELETLSEESYKESVLIMEILRKNLTLWTSNKQGGGYGNLSLDIEGPSKADIDCQDLGDGSCRVSYKPTEPGNYVINVKFADEHVRGSPFLVKIGGEPSGRVSERLVRQRDAADVTQVGSACELGLKIPGIDVNDMEASVTSPSGVTSSCEIKEVDKDQYSVSFVPKEMGVHSVSVKHNGLHIPGSPYQFTVGPISDGGAHKVRAVGPGLERGEVDKPCPFEVYTREAGAGSLAIAVDGPSKADIDFVDNKDGSCAVAYTCTEPGDYLVSVKFNDQHIPESPFMVQLVPSTGDFKKLTVDKLQDEEHQINKPVAFTVDKHGAQGKLDARVVAPSGAEEEARVKELDKDNCAVSFIPRENGVHMVHVRLNGTHIPGSPFRVLVGKSDADPGLVRAYGDGLSKGQAGQPCKFIVNTQKAGAGALAVSVDGPSKVQLTCQEAPGEGYQFTYTPTIPGDYLITVKYAGNFNIPGSPFKARIEGIGKASTDDWTDKSQVVIDSVTKSSTTQHYGAPIPGFDSDASKVELAGVGLVHAKPNEPGVFTVDASRAGQNMLLVGVAGPHTPCEEVHVLHRGNNHYDVNYKLKEPGNYVLVVKWGDQHVPGSPFKIAVK